MFPMPRVVYSMASDGLLFEFLAYLAPKLKTPVLASLVTGLLAAFLVLIFDLNQLIDMMSIGTLLAYSLVSTCTLVLRYAPVDEPNAISPGQPEDAVVAQTPPTETPTTFWTRVFGKSSEPLHKRLFWPASTKPNEATSHLVNVVTLVTVGVILILSCILNQPRINQASYAFVIIFLIVLLVLTYILWVQPQTDQITTFKVNFWVTFSLKSFSFYSLFLFKVPLVPFFPLLSTFVNVFLMVSLNTATWIRFGIWLFIGRYSFLDDLEIN
jgi:hypothetical protein